MTRKVLAEVVDCGKHGSYVNNHGIVFSNLSRVVEYKGCPLCLAEKLEPFLLEVGYTKEERKPDDE